MSIFKMSSLAKLTGNTPTQKFLNWNIRVSQFLIGNGSGNSVNESGESKIFNFLPNYSNAPYIIFDVGANEGQFSNVLLKNITSKSFEVHCFEPCEKSFKNLTNNIKDYRIKLNRLGIGANKCQRKIYYDQSDSVFASFAKRKSARFGASFNKSEVVRVETIDNYCKINNIKRINLLKIDIEGYELEALNGANDLFKNGLIDIVSFEFGAVNIDSRTFFIDFWRFFQEKDMSLFRLSPSGYLTELKSYNSRELEVYSTTIIIAINNRRL